VSLELRWEPRVVVIRFAGVVSPRDPQDATAAYEGDIRFGDLRFVIADYSAIAGCAASPGDMEMVAATNVGAAKSKPPHPQGSGHNFARSDCNGRALPQGTGVAHSDEIICQNGGRSRLAGPPIAARVAAGPVEPGHQQGPLVPCDAVGSQKGGQGGGAEVAGCGLMRIGVPEHGPDGA